MCIGFFIPKFWKFWLSGSKISMFWKYSRPEPMNIYYNVIKWKIDKIKKYIWVSKYLFIVLIPDTFLSKVPIRGQLKIVKYQGLWYRLFQYRIASRYITNNNFSSFFYEYQELWYQTVPIKNPGAYISNNNFSYFFFLLKFDYFFVYSDQCNITLFGHLS